MGKGCCLHGQHWESTLSDLLRTSRAALNATPFKGVTDVLLLGKTNALLIFVKDDDAVDATWSYKEGIDMKTILIEVGIGQIARVYCPTACRCLCSSPQSEHQQNFQDKP